MANAKSMIHVVWIPRSIGRFGATVYLLACMIALTSTANADRTTQIFTPDHRVADELLEIARGSLGGEGEVVLDGARNSLVLIGPESRVAEALSLLAFTDKPIPIVKIRYRALDLRSLSTTGVAVSWKTTPGVGVARVVSHGDVISSGRLYRTSEDSETTGELRIQSGQEGHVGRGRSIPLPIRDRFDRVVSGFAEAERGFSATPLVLGDGRIRLAIKTSTGRASDDGKVEYSNTESIVIANPGDTLAVGGLSEGSIGEQRDGKSHSTRADRREEVFLITVDVVAP